MLGTRVGSPETASPANSPNTSPKTPTLTRPTATSLVGYSGRPPLCSTVRKAEGAGSSMFLPSWRAPLPAKSECGELSRQARLWAEGNTLCSVPQACLPPCLATHCGLKTSLCTLWGLSVDRFQTLLHRALTRYLRCRAQLG